jgi:hypothetical protein
MVQLWCFSRLKSLWKTIGKFAYNTQKFFRNPYLQSGMKPGQFCLKNKPFLPEKQCNFSL